MASCWTICRGHVFNIHIELDIEIEYLRHKAVSVGQPHRGQSTAWLDNSFFSRV